MQTGSLFNTTREFLDARQFHAGFTSIRLDVTTHIIKNELT